MSKFKLNTIWFDFYVLNLVILLGLKRDKIFYFNILFCFPSYVYNSSVYNLNHKNDFMDLQIHMCIVGTSVTLVKLHYKGKMYLVKYENYKSICRYSIVIEVWKFLGELGVGWLTKLFKDILRCGRKSDWGEIILRSQCVRAKDIFKVVQTLGKSDKA